MVRRTVPLTTLLAGCALLACTGGPSGSDAPLVPGRVAGSSSGNSTAPGAAAGSTGGSAPGGPGPTSAPVSYTHLDVYKRQPFAIVAVKTITGMVEKPANPEFSRSNVGAGADASVQNHIE